VRQFHCGTGRTTAAPEQELRYTIFSLQTCRRIIRDEVREVGPIHIPHLISGMAENQYSLDKQGHKVLPLQCNMPMPDRRAPVDERFINFDGASDNMPQKEMSAAQA